MVLGAAAAATAATAGGSLFEYNRKNFLYDRKLRQETEYQIMDFRIKQAELWREDVRDIVGLTSVKMDTYLIVNAVQLGFCVMAFCEGRLAAGTPTWLIGCHTLSLAGAFMYLLMSVWLAMHASVTAKSYEVRLLTQNVRLPVPSWSQLEGARTYSSTFEKVEARQMFRMPFVMGTQEAVLRSSVPENQAVPALPTAPGSAAAAAAGGPAGAQAEGDASDGCAGSSDLWGLEGRGDGIYELDGSIRSDPRRLRHLQLVREAMQYWQSYDGFARVAMSMGTNQLVTALAYYVIGYVLISNHAVIAAWLVVMLFMVIAAALIRLDMSLTGLEYRVSVVLVISGPCLLAVASEQWARHTQVGDEVVNIVTPIAYLVHAMWLAFLLYISKVSEQKGGALLPTGFRSVMYIDVFGWIKGSMERQSRTEGLALPARPQTADAKVPGCGPAVQSVRYDEQGRPVPARPELLPGASQTGAWDGLNRQDFDPTTFVPREKDSEKGSESERVAQQSQMQVRPGVVPWRIFCAATVLLICLWCFAGAFVLLSSFGVQVFKVAPLLREQEGGESGGEQKEGSHATHEKERREAVFLQAAEMLQGGRALATRWPHSRVQPHGLACGDASGPTLVASTRFGLYSAQVGSGAPKPVVFEEMPCEGVEGESVGDVAMLCGRGSQASCYTLALHQQGQRLSACSLPTGQVPANLSQLPESPVPSTVADMWLRRANKAEGRPQEEVFSFALASECLGDSSALCAYMETSSGRIVEVEESGAGSSWFPTRALRGESPGDGAVMAGGALSMVAGGRYLASLQLEQGFMDLLRPRDGALAGRWRLPQGHDWAAMCSRGGDIFLLSAGRQPELWKFPVPTIFAEREHAARAAQEQAASRAGRMRGHRQTVLAA